MISIRSVRHEHKTPRLASLACLPDPLVPSLKTAHSDDRPSHPLKTTHIKPCTDENEMSEDESFTYFVIPKGDDIKAMAPKYRTLRLRALKASPASFGSTYELEAVLADAQWVARLAERRKETIICARFANKGPVADPSEGEWIGSLTIRGPLSKGDFILPEASGQALPRDDNVEERWQMLALFVLPEYRRRGLAKGLCKAAMAYLRHYNTKPPTVLLRLMVRPDNSTAMGLYTGLGFRESGTCTLLEALVANGDTNLLPRDVTGETYTKRGGVIMTYRIVRF